MAGGRPVGGEPTSAENFFVDKPRYVDNIIDKEVRVPVERYIEVNKEVIVERKVQQFIDRPVPYERIITRDVEVPVENIIYQEVDYVIERPALHCVCCNHYRSMISLLARLA